MTDARTPPTDRPPFILSAIDQHAIVSVADAQGRITHVNDRFCAVSGYPREELIGQNHSIVKSGLHSPAFYRAMWSTLTRGETWHGEICNRRKDGSFYWVNATIVPFPGDDGRSSRYVSVRTDISDLKLTEIALLRQRDMNAMISGIAARLLAASADDLDTTIDQALQQSGEHLNADRAYLFLTSPDGLRFSNTHEWCAQGVASQRDTLQDLPVEIVPWFWDTLRSGEAALIADVSALPSEATAEQQLFSELGVRSLFSFPLMNDGHAYGFIGYDAVRQRRDWLPEEMELLKLIADIIGCTFARHRAERAARTNAERFRLGQSFANIGTWEWNISSGDLYWSERIPSLFGHAQGTLETSYGNFLAAVHPDDRQRVIDAINAAVDFDKPYELEHRVVWPDGTEHWLLERGAVVRSPEGEAQRMIGVVQDITERIEANRQLRDTEERFAFAVEGAGDGVWDWNVKTGAMQLTGHYEAMLGFEPGEMEPDIEAWRKRVHPDDIAHVEHALQDYLEGRAPGYALELRIRCKDGNYKWILCRGTVVTRDGAGNPERMIGIHSDISAQKQAEQALIDAREDADRANRAKSEFLSSMSHELRTPMNAILGFSQLMHYDDDLAEEHKDNVREILKAGHHLLELINEVLDLAKIESGSIQLSLEPLMLRPIVDECVGLMSNLAGKRGIAIRYLPLDNVAVRADRTRLRQVLLNLLSNAVKYNRDAGSVGIGTENIGDGRVRINVTDTGIGISRERLSEIFQPFNRLGAEYGDVEGTGIGLTITRRIVEMMGGAIGVESKPGEGSIFWFELPMESVPVDNNDIGTRATTNVTPADSRAAEQHAILYIEDNPANLKLVAQILGRRRNIRLFTAHTPELGIELALAINPNLILLDINIPGMDGYQVMNVFRADPMLRNIPVIALTANAMPRDIERGRQAGFADYLTKPLDLARFNAAIDRIFGTDGDDSGDHAR